MLVGISGNGRAGKDSVGRVLAQEHGFRTIAFADLMRSCALALNPIVAYISPRPCEHQALRYSDVLKLAGYDQAKTEYAEVREFLQRLGTEMGRRVLGEDFWVDATFALMDLSENWAITDVRFKNEAQAVVDHGGFVVRVTRPGVGPANDHISEHGLDDWSFNYELHNNGTLEDLRHKTSRMLMLVAVAPSVSWDVV